LISILDSDSDIFDAIVLVLFGMRGQVLIFFVGLEVRKSYYPINIRLLLVI
jgi:hypothetical protein